MGKYKTALLTTVAPLATDHVRPFDGERPYIATGGLNNEESISPEMVTYEGRPSRADLTVQAGDICFARMKETLKILHCKPDHSDLLLSTGFAVLRPQPDQLNARYLFHYLRTPAFQNAKDSLCSGATQKAITNGKMNRLKIPLLSLEEQKRIAAMLDKADELRRKRRESIAALDSLTQSIFLDLFGDPVTNPKKWKKQKLSDVGTLDRGKSKHRPRNAPELLGGPYPLVQTGDVANSGGRISKYSQTYSEIGLQQSRIWPAGTLCITIAANIAKTGILMFDACFPDSVVGFHPNDGTRTEYVQIWLSFLQKHLEDTAPESAQKNINLEILRNLTIPIPSIDMQIEFVKRCAAIQTQRVKLLAAQTETENLFTALQQKAFAQ